MQDDGTWWTGRFPGWNESLHGSCSEAQGIENEDLQRLRDVLATRINPAYELAPERHVNFETLAEGHEKGNTPIRKPASNGPPTYFRMVDATSFLVRETLKCNGLLPTEDQSSHNWSLQWSGPAASTMPRRPLKEHQKVNHFPGSAEMTRKDKLWANFALMRKSCGRKAFDFVPESYVLPAQFPEFVERHGRANQTWIVKPRAGGQGNGIFLLRDISELPPKNQYVVSRYIDNPLLIQGLKFDLRIYVLVTGWRPLRVYVYREGLCRFAVKPYSMAKEHLGDVYRHLTNYSVNKYSRSFVENQDAKADNVGHKWSLSALNRHLTAVGVDVQMVWSRILDVIMKTLLSCQKPISEHVRNLQASGQGPSADNCFELFGFDVMLDDTLKPWIIEVNHSPSMHAVSPLDWRVKSSLFCDTLNLVGIAHEKWPWKRNDPFQRPDQRSSLGAQRMSLHKSASTPALSSSGGASGMDVDSLNAALIDSLSEAQRRQLKRVLQEMERSSRNFIRLAPSRATMKRYARIAARVKAYGALDHIADIPPPMPSALADVITTVLCKANHALTDHGCGPLTQKIEEDSDDETDYDDEEDDMTDSAPSTRQSTARISSRGRGHDSFSVLPPIGPASRARLPYPVYKPDEAPSRRSFAPSAAGFASAGGFLSKKQKNNNVNHFLEQLAAGGFGGPGSPLSSVYLSQPVVIEL